MFAYATGTHESSLFVASELNFPHKFSSGIFSSFPENFSSFSIIHFVLIKIPPLIVSLFLPI